jgi:hypothetical protein
MNVTDFQRARGVPHFAVPHRPATREQEEETQAAHQSCEPM